MTATDAKGAQTTSSEYSYTLKDDDTTPPIITFGGSQGTESHKAKQEFTWDVVDPPDPTYPYVSSGVGTVNVVVMQDGNPTPIYNNPAAPAKGSFNFDSYGLGTYTITVTATDADKDCVTATDSDAAKAGPVSRTVKVTNDPPVAEAGPGQRVDEGTLVRFDGGNSYDPEGDPLTYLWDFGDGNTGTGVQPSHTYQDAGAYPVLRTPRRRWRSDFAE